MLNHSEPEDRRTAALSLGKIGDGRAAGALVERLHDSDPLVRRFSAWALGQLPPDDAAPAVPHLTMLLSDRDPAVGEAASQALGQVASAGTAAAAVVKILEEGPPQSRLAAVKALVWLETPEAYGALVRALEDEAAPVRQTAVAALGELGDPRAVAPIAERLSSDQDAGVRSEAAFRLGKFGEVRVRHVLERATADPQPIVRLWASWAIAQLAPPGAPGSGT